MATKEYDLNVYVVDGVARLSAYEYKYSDRPDGGEPIATRTDDWHTLEIPLNEANGKELAFLLDDLKWDDLGDTDLTIAEKWDDYDGPWLVVSEFEHAPKKIADWVASLPEYEPTPEHEWEPYKMDLVMGEHRDVKCLNCEATFPLVRLSWEDHKALTAGRN